MIDPSIYEGKLIVVSVYMDSRILEKVRERFEIRGMHGNAVVFSHPDCKDRWFVISTITDDDGYDVLCECSMDFCGSFFKNDSTLPKDQQIANIFKWLDQLPGNFPSVIGPQINRITECMMYTLSDGFQNEDKLNQAALEFPLGGCIGSSPIYTLIKATKRKKQKPVRLWRE